jgi:gamma-glutamyltranspeptidase/glutathione hydrolase
VKQLLEPVRSHNRWRSEPIIGLQFTKVAVQQESLPEAPARAETVQYRDDDGALEVRRRQKASGIGAFVVGLAAAVGVVSMARQVAAEAPGVRDGLVHQLVARPAFSDRAMVASSTPLANQVGIDVLAAGGNAVDAAVAMSIALGASDPGDSGLGGAVYMLVRMADGRTVAFDGSATVPRLVSRPALMKVKEAERRYGPELAATPGALAALETARQRFGTMDLARLVEPSIALAEAGFELTPFQSAAIARYPDDVRANEPLVSIVMDEEQNPKLPGSRVRFPGHADFLRRVAEGGVDEFFRGSIAAAIEQDMIRRGGFVRRHDLALVRGRELEPLRGTYRGHEILTYPAPGAGAALLESLNILECLPAETLVNVDAATLHFKIEAFHIAIEDHRAMTPDAGLPPRFQDLKYAGKVHSARRCELINFGSPIGGGGWAPDERPELENQTVQISVVDETGNAVSLTQSLGRFYGNKVVAHEMGFLYNAFLTGADPLAPRKLRPGRILPADGAPTIVVTGGKPWIVLGTSGSSRIPGIIATVVSNVVDHGMTLSEAIEAPRVLWSQGQTSRGVLTELAPPLMEDDFCSLEHMGYRIGREVRFPTIFLQLTVFGGVNAVLRDPETGRLEGVGDPRRTGYAMGLH